MHPSDVDDLLNLRKQVSLIPKLELSVDALGEMAEELKDQRDSFRDRAVFMELELQKAQVREKTAWLRHAWWLVPGALTGLIVGFLI